MTVEDKIQFLELLETYKQYFSMADHWKTLESFLCYAIGYLGIKDTTIMVVNKKKDFMELAREFRI